MHEWLSAAPDARVSDMNNFLDLTPGSTHATDNAVKLYMPPVEAVTVLAYLDRLQALEAKQPDPAHARQCRSADIEKLVLSALDNATLHIAVMAVNPCFRTKKVRDHLREYKTRYGITKPPSSAKVREILMKHGYIMF